MAVRPGLGIRIPDRDGRGERQWAARTLSARDQIVTARREGGTQRVSNGGEFDEFGVDFGQLHPGAGLQSGVCSVPVAKVADLEQVGDLVEGEAMRCAALITRSTVTASGG